MSLTNTQILLSQATPLLSREAEKALFIKLDGARKLRDSSRLSFSAMSRVKKLESEVVAANLPLVVHIVNKIAQREDSGVWGNAEMDEWYNGSIINVRQLISEGLKKLLECIEAFKVEKGFKFSTYFYRSLYRSCHRFIHKEAKWKWRHHLHCTESRQRVSNNMAHSEYRTSSELIDNIIDLTDALRDNRAGLTEMEMFVVNHHYGIDNREPKTFRELHVLVEKKNSISMSRLQNICREATQKLKTALV